jgi:pilus assembly protein Flp/PilA
MFSAGGAAMMVSFSAFRQLLTWVREREEDGQGLAEYGLILALVAVVAITALSGLGSSIVGTLGQVVSAL